MSKGIFERRPNEPLASYVIRLHVDPWFEDCTPAELADFTGAPLKKVRRAVYSWAKSRKVRRIHQHATAVAEQIGWHGTPEGLVHLALERYAQRFTERTMVATSKQDEIDWIMSVHKMTQETGSGRPS